MGYFKLYLVREEPSYMTKVFVDIFWVVSLISGRSNQGPTTTSHSVILRWLYTAHYLVSLLHASGLPRRQKEPKSWGFPERTQGCLTEVPCTEEIQRVYLSICVHSFPLKWKNVHCVKYKHFFLSGRERRLFHYSSLSYSSLAIAKHQDQDNL